MLPQITRTVKLADEVSKRLAAPLENVIPGLDRLAATLDSPVLRSLPTDLGQFMEVINDLGRRMSPLAQIAEQAGSMFGLRIPGFHARVARRRPARPTPRRRAPSRRCPATSATTPARQPAPRPRRRRRRRRRRPPASAAAARKR